MRAETSLRIERVPAPRRRPTAPGAAAAAEDHWVIYSGTVPVLRCDREADARALVEVVAGGPARTTAGATGAVSAARSARR